MAYSRIHSLIAALSALIITAWSDVVSAVTMARDYLQELRWPRYAPDVGESLHADHLRHEIEATEPQGILRSLSFRMRALLHDLFAGSGFVEPQAAGTA